MLRLAIAAVLSLAAFSSVAQEAYPSRPVKFIVPFSAGGPLDVPARLIASKLTDLWDKPVIVENQPGASGSIGAAAVARAAPDGYTLLVTVDIPVTMFPAVAKKLPYDPVKDLVPVGAFARLQNGLFVNPSVGVETTAQLVELAKKSPGKLTFSSAGIASPAHMAGELFKVAAGIDMTHVPYKGAAPAMAAALSGEVDMMFGPITQGLPQVKSGKLRALGVTGPNPSRLLPDVKPLSKQGFPDLIVYNWEGVFAPSGTPQNVLRAVDAGWAQVMKDREVRARLEGMDLVPVWEGSDSLKKTMAADLKRWTELAKRAGIQSPQ